MVPDLKFVTATFLHFNTLIFGGALPVPRFRMTHARTFHGKLVYKITRQGRTRRCTDFEMRISLDFDLTPEEWEDVVIHEMIHLSIADSGMTDSSSHGPLFRQIMTNINRKHGRNVTVSAHTTPEQLDSDKRVRGHYVCIVKFSDGRLGVAPVAKSRIFELWDTFPTWPEIVAVNWIGTIDPWFNRFPRVMKTKVYIVKREDLMAHVKGALKLEVFSTPQGRFIRTVNPECPPEELIP